MELGTWADWANVAGAAVVGGAVTLLTFRTNKLAESANRTSQAMVDLETQRAIDDAAMRASEQRLILIALHDPIGISQASLSVAYFALEKPDYFENFVHNATARGAVKEAIEKARIDMPETLRSRLHYLEPSLAGRIVRIESAASYLITMLTFIPTDDSEFAKVSARGLHKSIKRYVDEISIVREASRRECESLGLLTPTDRQPSE